MWHSTETEALSEIAFLFFRHVYTMPIRSIAFDPKL